MKIGLVLSHTPQYSETFFISKIKGLKSYGFNITLFAEVDNSNFSLCKLVLAPKVPKLKTLKLIKTFFVILVLALQYPQRLNNFIKLERTSGRKWMQILKNLYTNSHILKADLDWLHFGFATMALQSENVAETIGAKMAVSFRGYDIDVFPLKHHACYMLLWKKVDKVHAISHYLLEKAYALGLSNTRNYSIITPAIDINKFKKQRIGAVDSVLNILTLARLEWIKGLVYVLEALAILKKKGLHFHFTIIGSGRLKDELLFAIYQLRLADCVTILDKVVHETVSEHLINSEIYIQYSESEGFCNAVLEAQAMGCLCIVSDGGALTENVIDNQTGWVVPKRNPELLASKIEDVIALSENEKQLIRTEAIKRVKKEFNLKQQQKAFVEFYE